MAGLRFRGFRGRRYIAMIGSRKAPPEFKPIFQDIGECFCDDGIAVTSGDAEGCDEWSVEGAMRSPAFPQIGARVYLAWNGYRRYEGAVPSHRYEDGVVYFDASKFENWQQAHEISLKARGSWDGLRRGGIALQVRNAYQVLLDDLQSPVGAVVCWAKLIGRKGQVSGGTNTAVQIAVAREIPVINLATDQGLERALAYLRKKGKLY